MERPSSRPPSFRIEFPPELPISARAAEIIDAIGAHPVVILAGETGSGKTTQIPKMCLAAGRGRTGRIACTQPRRVAALSVSRRVAEELGVRWGGPVGCKIRFSDQTSDETTVKFMTDGMLLAEMQGDPMLGAYDTIIIDEAHERSLNIDFLIGHLRQLRFRRPELKIIITSATIDTASFSKAFDDAPVIEVSGRTFPVEVIYAPLDELGSDAAEGDEREARAEALHYIDGAVEAVDRIVRESEGGDVLVFMPAERDIRETMDLLSGRLRGCELIPLFGRLSNAEQQRVFASGQKRKIIVATNIAETSLTIPGIRFVVDTGLARISRYVPQARTRRLPIEPVAQSSADQRKGRAGRVSAGVCIRLYSEKDFNERPRFAQPEIQRANLADVILRMLAFGLGDIERFPFINMPAAKAIRSGHLLLEELGALEPEAGSARALAPLGRELARLPVDPTAGRMILQARAEKAVREVVVIASGLSIQDPRERPLDAREKADAAHRRFVHPDSDFLTLLNIWDAFHDEFENLSQAKLRRFCRDHFLSYTRMREWRDIHAQLMDVMTERADFPVSSVFDGLSATKAAEAKLDFGTPAYRAIHRSILSGLLGNIALRDDEKGGFKATQDRRVSIFPGSVLFRREEKARRPDGGARKPADAGGDKRGPRWIMAAEVMETSRLYARTCARLDPQWVLDLGAHVLKRSHSEPFWDAESGRVRVKQKTRLHGLEIESRAVSYGKIDPVHATDIFIREALVNDTVSWPFDFLAHNRAERERIELLLSRARHGGYMNLDEAVHRFYADRIDPARDGAVSSVAELIALVRERKAEEPRFLFIEPADLRLPEEVEHDEAAYPAALPLGTAVLSLQYLYKPGQSDDGVTLDVGVREAGLLTPAELDWAVPGHLAPKIEEYLRALPKELRRTLAPLTDTARALAEAATSHARLTAKRDTLAGALAILLRERHRLAVDPAVWDATPLPDHLRVRVRVLDDEGRELCASRDLAEIRTLLAERKREASVAISREEPDVWRKARARWEKSDQTEWTFEALPERIHLCDQAGVPVHAYPALKPSAAGVSLRLMRTQEEAMEATPAGLSRLLELQLRHELLWLQKDLRDLRSLGALTATLTSGEVLQADAFAMLRGWLCDPGRVGAPTAEAFAAGLERARSDLRGVVPRLGDLLREILTLRQTLLVNPHPYPGMSKDLERLMPADLLRHVPFERLAHFPRYLKAMHLRAERWRQNPAKDAERAAQLAPYAAAVAEVAGRPGGEAFRWSVEELRVSLFAQELGTAESVSTVKLDRALEALRGRRPGQSRPVAAATPIVAQPVKPAEGGRQKIKSLNALGSLFGK